MIIDGLWNSEQPHFSLLIRWLHWEFIFPIKIQSYHPPTWLERLISYSKSDFRFKLWSGFQVFTKAHSSACLAKFPRHLHTYLSHHTHTHAHTHTWLTKFRPAFASRLNRRVSPFLCYSHFPLSHSSLPTLLWTTSKILQSCLRFFRRQ